MRRASLVLALLLAASGFAAAARKTKPPAPPAAARAPVLPAEKLDRVRALLQGDDDRAAIEAAGALAESGAANAADPLLELLAAGTVPERTQAALDALGKLGDPRTVDVLELYAGHRTPEVRRHAVRALGAVPDPRAVTPLLARLGDVAPDVRAAAAEALAARKESRAAPRLFALVKRNDAGAAGPLGLLANPDMVPRLAELQGSVDDGLLATALGEYVKRDDVVRTIARLSGAGATAALVEYLGSIPAKDDRPSKKEAQKLLDQRGVEK